MWCSGMGLGASPQEVKRGADMPVVTSAQCRPPSASRKVDALAIGARDHAPSLQAQVVQAIVARMLADDGFGRAGGLMGRGIQGVCPA